MAPPNALRRLLRRIPAFRSLPAAELEKVLQQMEVREYQAGHVLWRTRRPLDFWGVLEQGEIALEEWNLGACTQTVHLGAGDYVGPYPWKPAPDSTLTARALTDARLWVIPCDRLAGLTPGRQVTTAPPGRRSWVWNSLLFVLSALLVFTLGRPDISRILSGAMLLEARRQQSTAPGLNEPVKLLGLAESLDPGASFAYNQQGYWMFGSGDLQKAGESFAEAVDIGAPGGAALNNQAVTYLAQGGLLQAVQIQEQAVQNDPDNAQVHYNLGIMQRKVGQTDEALRQWKEAAFIRPDWSLPLEQQAVLHLELRDYSQAEEAARRAQQLDPQQPTPYVVLAIALYEQGRDPEALAAADQALALSPQDSVPAFYKALILARTGQREAALSLLYRLFVYARDPAEIRRIAAEIQFLEDARQVSSSPVP